MGLSYVLKILHVSLIATLALQILYSIVACCTMITGTIGGATMPHLCPKVWSMKSVWAKFKAHDQPHDWSWSLKTILRLPTLSTYLIKQRRPYNGMRNFLMRLFDNNLGKDLCSWPKFWCSHGVPSCESSSWPLMLPLFCMLRIFIVDTFQCGKFLLFINNP